VENEKYIVVEENNIEITDNKLIAVGGMIHLMNTFMKKYDYKVEDMKRLVDSAIEMEEDKYIISYKDYNYYIEDTLIPSEAMEEVDWGIIDREDFLSDLVYTMIPQAHNSNRNHDLYLMEEDRDYLSKYEDKYILSSLSTNDYLIPSEESELFKFNEVCERLLEEAKKQADSK